MGSTGLGSLVAVLAFPILLLVGWMRGELGPRGTMLFVILGLSVWVALPRFVPNGHSFITPALALIDIALVLAVFKGDVRIS
jgi:hypothetical protein